MTSRRTFLVSLAALSVTRPALPVLRAQDITIGTNTGATAARLALPEFVSRATDSDALTVLFNETLRNDLDYSGVVMLISPSFYPLGRFGQPQDIVAEAWTSETVDSEFLAFGNGSVRGGQFVVEGRLWDMKEPRIAYREVLGQSYRTELTERAVRLVAHTLADDIVEKLGGGILGVARTQIAYESKVGGAEKAIFVMDYDGENARQITPAGVLAVTPNWAPDGQRIAFTSYERDKADIAVISPVDRRGFPFETFLGTTTTPAFSPDGSRVAFASSMREVRGQPDMEIYIADSQGRNPRPITVQAGVDLSPVWNPRTGQELAFVSDRSGTPQVYVVDAEGGNLRRLIEEGGDAGDPAWSPNGTLIAFSWQKSRESTRDIYIHDLTTRRNFQLTENAGFNENPSWSPDGRHLAFESNRNGTIQIFTMLADGRSERQLTRQGSNTNPAWSSYMG